MGTIKVSAPTRTLPMNEMEKFLRRTRLECLHAGAGLDEAGARDVDESNVEPACGADWGGEMRP